MNNGVRVKTRDELHNAVTNLRKEFTDSLLLFRGQNRLYESIRSGRSRPDYKPAPLVESGWSAMASKLLGLPIASTHLGTVQAILQHYGCATHYVDLTSDVDVAAWFAIHQYSSDPRFWVGNAFRRYDRATYTRLQNPTAYVLVLSISNHLELQAKDRLVDLSALSEDFLRPRRQKAWLLLDRPPTKPLPNDFWVATLELDPSSYAADTGAALFPDARDDAAFRELSSLPFVQVPFAYLNAKRESDGKDNAETKVNDPATIRALEEACTAVRILDLPEYSEDHDHKWIDLTLYEPHPMRMWRGWLADLEELHGGIKGNIRDAVKISLSPAAKRRLDSTKEIDLAWPALGANGYFFTYAALDHDKVIEHGPPYFGVWLQKDRELIVEVPMSSDGEALITHTGHAYFLRNGGIERQEMESSCKCEDPESHDRRVASVLRLQKLVEAGEIILLPHPFFGDVWYVAITGDDAGEMTPQIESGRRAFRKVIEELANPIP